MNQYPLWKNLLIMAVITIGVIYAIPNLFSKDPAIQVSAGRYGKVDLNLLTQVEAALKAQSIVYIGAELSQDRLLVRFADQSTQLKARAALQEAIKGDYIIAFNLAETTPSWLSGLGGKAMNLGLDLRGGVHFLMEVDMDAAEKKALTGIASEIRPKLREEKIRYRRVEVIGKQLQITFRDKASQQQALGFLRTEYNDITVAEGESEDQLLLSLSARLIAETKRNALEQNIITLRNRINELGVAEPIVQQQGDSRIVVQLPGVQDTAQAKKILGATATLAFHLVDNTRAVQDALNGRTPAGSKVFYHRNGQPYLLKKRVILTGEHIINSVSTLDPDSGSPAVSVTLDGKGARSFSQVTGKNIGQPMAVVFMESKTETSTVGEVTNRVRRQHAQIISVATIQDQLAKKFQITGLDSGAEASELALLLRSGALAAPIEIIEERTVGPSLGLDNIEQGMQSVLIGFGFVLLFMLLWYRLFGLVANIALAVNLILIVALLSLFQATLTLPGIAGIVLTVGMAVDANVLIFERIREEIREGNSPQISINAGYDKAFSTIADANITTLIAAIVLFSFGSGTIKGFAVTLSFGILTSMFTAILGTRAIINWRYGRQSRPKLSL